MAAVAVGQLIPRKKKEEKEEKEKQLNIKKNQLHKAK